MRGDSVWHGHDVMRLSKVEGLVPTRFLVVDDILNCGKAVRLDAFFEVSASFLVFRVSSALVTCLVFGSI